MRRACGLVLLAVLAGCAPPLPVAEAGQAPARLEPAPRPSVRYVPRGGSAGAFEIPLPSKMPLGTGAVPVSSGVARGSIVTGLRESF